MTRINLYPWRAARQKERNRQFLLACIAISGLTLLLLILYQHSINAQLAYQQRRNQYITDAGTALARQIKELQSIEATRKNLLGKIDVIDKLQQQRVEAVRLFDELGRTVPDDVQLTQLIQNGRTLKISGIATSNNGISQYIRRIESSAWLPSPLLDVIESAHDYKASPLRGKRFTLLLTLPDPPPPSSP